MDLASLPAEVILEEIIVKNKDVSTILATCRSNKVFQDLCRNDNFWLKLYYKYYGDSGMLEIIQGENRFINWYELFKLCFALNKVLVWGYFNSSKYDIKKLYITFKINIFEK